VHYRFVIGRHAERSHSQMCHVQHENESRYKHVINVSCRLVCASRGVVCAWRSIDLERHPVRMISLNAQYGIAICLVRLI